MRGNIEERVIKVAEHIIDTNQTIRQTMVEFGYSKSTIHKDLKDRLPQINPELSKEITFIMQQHLATRHINGGRATKEKYKTMKS